MLYTIMVVVTFVVLYLTAYAVLHQSMWDRPTQAGVAVVCAVFAAMWPVSFTLWAVAMIVIGPLRFLFHYMEDVVDHILKRSERY